jgi:hypothetical protein
MNDNNKPADKQHDKSPKCATNEVADVRFRLEVSQKSNFHVEKTLY